MNANTISKVLTGAASSGLVAAAIGLWSLHADVAAVKQQGLDTRADIARLYMLILDKRTVYVQPDPQPEMTVRRDGP